MTLPDPVGPIEGILTPPNRSIVARVLTALLLIFAVVLVTTAIKLHHNIDEIRAAESDNKVWNIVQFEVDYRDLRIEVLIANDRASRAAGNVPEADLRDLRMQFDIFYSRINALFATLTSSGLGPAFQEEMSALTAARAELADRIDALRPAPDLAAELAQLTADVAALETLVRRLSVDALQIMVARAEAARLQERKLLAALFGASIALIGLTIVSMILSVRLGRSHAAAETRLERSTALAKAAFESSVTAMLICDGDGRILLTNPAASVVFGHDYATLQGHNLQETLIPPERLGEYRRFLRFIRQTGDADDAGDATIGPVQVVAQRATGEVFPAAVLVRITRLDAEQRLILVFVQDISDQVEFEQRLQQAADEARRYATAQGRFLATMSHELRTPLHGVRAALDLLSRQSLSADAETLVRIAQQSCGHALQQTDSALDAIRATHENEAEVPFDPVRIAHDLTEEMRLIGHPDGTRLSFSVTGDAVSAALMGRPRAFTRALGNLIANATKYAPGGSVMVRLDFSQSDAEGRVRLRAEVIDDGPGIPAQKIDRIFEPFNHDLLAEQKADGAGFGLGLSIVKQAVELMEGEISVVSDCGKGCHATIALSLERAQEPVSALTDPIRDLAASHQPGKGARALVVDDAQINCQLVARMLVELGFRVDTAFCGADAVAMAQRKSYDLILMDFYMPMMTGLEAVRHIRAGGPSQAARIIGITARVDLIGSDEGNPEEMDGVLFKPFGLAELESFLAVDGTSNAPALAQTAPVTPHAPTDAMSALRATLEMCGALLGLELLRDTLTLAHQAVAQTHTDRLMCAETAHRAAGAAMMSGLHDLGRALRELEQEARCAADPAKLSQLTARLSEATGRAERLVAELELETQTVSALN